MKNLEDYKLRRGLKDVFVAKVMQDDDTAFVTGTPRYLMPSGEMTRTAESNTANTWFDDTIFATVGSEGATTINLTGASMRVPEIAELMGKEIDSTTGAVIDDGNYHETYWAFGGTAEGQDGSEEKFWFAKGTFTPPEEQDKTIDDSTDANTMTVVYNAIKTKHIFTNGKRVKAVKIDSKSTKLKTSQDWTAQVVTPDNLSTICEKVIPVPGLTLSASTARIAEGGTKQLTATLAPTGATGTITWLTSNASVATVSTSGLVTGVDAGTATIIAMCGGFVATCVVTVTE